MRLEGAVVLLVDDEPDLREIFSAWLEHAGCKVLTATNGAEALEVLQAWKIDALVSDIRMPIMDGMALVRTVYERKLPIRTVILVSGCVNAGPRGICGPGVDAVMEKPLNRNDLLRVLRECLRKGGHTWLTRSASLI